MLELVELEGDHTEAERAELHDGEENPFESLHLGIAWEDHERRLVIRDDGRMIACAGPDRRARRKWQARRSTSSASAA